MSKFYKDGPMPIDMLADVLAMLRSRGGSRRAG